MTTVKKSTGIYWIVFLIATAALFVAIVTGWPWLTMILPFMLTSFVKAMDII